MTAQMNGEVMLVLPSDDAKPRSEVPVPGKTLQKQNMDIFEDNKRTISMKVCFCRHS